MTFPISGKVKVMFQTTNQMMRFLCCHKSTMALTFNSCLCGISDIPIRWAELWTRCKLRVVLQAAPITTCCTELHSPRVFWEMFGHQTCSRWNLLTWNYATRGCKKFPCFSTSCFPNLLEAPSTNHRTVATGQPPWTPHHCQIRLQNSQLLQRSGCCWPATGRQELGPQRQVGQVSRWNIQYTVLCDLMCLYHSIYSIDVWKVYWISCACHPCAGAMLIFSVPFQFDPWSQGNPIKRIIMSYISTQSTAV